MRQLPRISKVVAAGFVSLLIIAGCSNNPESSSGTGGSNPDTSAMGFQPTKVDSLNPHIKADYTSIAAFSDHNQWGSHNVHDPSVIKVNGEYYMFTTDVAYGDNLDKVGIQVRKSSDLVHWQFIGWAFDNGIPPKELQFMKNHQPGYQQKSIWAPFIMKVGNQFRLYYAVPGNNGLKLAAIGLATSTSITGPWNDKGIVISTTKEDPINSIDPTVIVNRNNGSYWMAYGSYYAGIYIVQLNPKTGMLLHSGDTGKRIAYRTNNNHSIEGSDIRYNPDTKKYYLFVSYGWLEDTYNVRVGRADQPQGPYLDFNGRNMADKADNLPRITAEYSFDNGPGWQGIGGNCTLKVGNQYYFISQARPHFNKYLMDLHVRRMLWLPDGWPVVSPERYDAVPQPSITKKKLEGNWQYIELSSTSLLNKPIHIQLMPDGSVKGGGANGSWSYQNNILRINWNNGKNTVQAKAFAAWDWENNVYTLVFTGLNSNGIEVWGKKTG